MPGSGVQQVSPAERPSRYEVQRLLGRGGMSEVFLAVVHGPAGFRRHVALKRLLPGLEAGGGFPAHALVNEAKILAQVDHPAVVQLFDFCLIDDRLTLVLELVDGLSLLALQRVLHARGDALPDAASLLVVHRLLEGLAALHAAADPATGRSQPIIHRDVTPANVLVPSDGHAKLVDFGIAVRAGASRDTPAGIVKGTDGYMAPEQAAAGVISVACDVFAACVIAHELLSGARAFPRAAADRKAGRLRASAGLTPLGMLRPELPRRLTAAIDAGLAADPAKRISAREVGAVIATCAALDEGRRALAAALTSALPARVDATSLTTVVDPCPPRIDDTPTRVDRHAR